MIVKYLDLTGEFFKYLLHTITQLLLSYFIFLFDCGNFSDSWSGAHYYLVLT